MNEQIGPYRIEREIGRGGMGVVYLARDTKLDRDVAIKALPPELAEDADRLARFEREARTLAQLNHTNIAGIHGIEEQDGQKYLILEYVEGETLAERLDRGPIPADEALEIAIEIANGVEAAHEAGVIHRDLKPDNIKITPDGKVKVLDFGLARPTEASSGAGSSDAATLTSPTPGTPRSPTIPGAILGTAPYMSPEQARGRPVDKRTDIWSFGAILFEMLTGANPFAGETDGDSIGAVLHKPIDLATLPASTPPLVRHVLARCLERDKANRYRDIGDVRIELAGVAGGGGFELEATARPAPTGASGLRPRHAVVLVVIVIVTGTIAYVSGQRAVPTPEPVRDRFEFPLRQDPTYSVGRPVISPDGTLIAYIDQGRVWIRPLDSFDAREVTDSEHGEALFWSPDSQWLGFARGTEIVKVPATGGRPTIITRADSSFSLVGSAKWSTDDRIFFATGDAGIEVVSAKGGEPREYIAVEPSDDDDFHEIALLPDNRTVVFSVHSKTRPWYLAISDGAHRRELLSFERHGIMTPVYARTGHILFHRFGEDHGVWALPFSVETMEATGEPFIVAPDSGSPSVSDDGTLTLTRRIIGIEGGDLIRFTPESSAMEPLLEPVGQYYDPVISPDGSMLAVAGFAMGAVDIWLVDLETDNRTRLTFDETTNELLPRFSPDGKEIAYAKTVGSTFERSGPEDTIHFVAVDGSGETREPIDGGYPSFDDAWTSVAFTRLSDDTGRDIYALPLDGSAPPKPVLDTRAKEEQPALSPDGEFLAYVSDESGHEAVYVTRFPGGEGKWQVSTGLGFFPVWSRDGTRLYYAGPEVNIVEVEISRDDRFMIGQPRTIMEGPRLGLNPYLGYSASPSGNSIMLLRPKGNPQPPAIGVIRNWYEEFRDR